MTSRVDPWGRVLADVQTVEDVILSGKDFEELWVTDDQRFQKLNEWLKVFDKPEFLLSKPQDLDISPEEEHRRRGASWSLGAELVDVDIRALMLELCSNQAEQDRVNEEMDLFEERDLMPLLRCMMALVDHLRRNNVVWGVGRGSSVASFVLYLIGVHRINPMIYDLSIRDFLK
jgi:DNA polymerase III alpha subunit